MEKLKNLKIMVTGGTGFIGSHLVSQLIEKSAKVIVPYIKIDPGSLLSNENLFKKIILVKVNIANIRKVIELTQKYKIDYIFHLAAQTLVTDAYLNPYNTLKTNILGTVAVLEATRKSKQVKGVIVASSDKAYGKTTKTYNEDFPLRGDHPYDVSKSSADLIAQTYYKTYGIPVVITRFGNVYGEGDLHFDRIIPGTCETIINNKPLKIRSNGKYVRDYIYVKDVVNGYLTLLKNINTVQGHAYNFSSSDTLSVIQLIKKFEKILNIKVPYTILNIAKNEIPYQHLNDSKIKKLGWNTKYNLDNSLKNVFFWYKKYLK